MDAVNVVVTCTKEKKAPVDADCALRSLPTGTLRERFAEWKRRLSQQSRRRVRVEDLYAGDHWATVRSFHSTRFAIHVWVCSAGYGLVQLRDSITPYSATFSARHPDSVVRHATDASNADAARRWWELLTKWRAQMQGNPRGLRELAAEYPDRAMLVVASKTYLNAIAGDLRLARRELSAPDLLSIVSAGSKTIDGLEEHLVPCDARLQVVVGGARRSLNTRVARKLLGESRMAPRYSMLAKRMRSLLADAPAIEQYDRVSMSDTEVRSFIVRQLRDAPHLCHSPLLRRLRESGHACEQKRFAKLYRELKEQMNGEA